MALQHYDTYTSVCGQYKFIDIDDLLVEEEPEEVEPELSPYELIRKTSENYSLSDNEYTLLIAIARLETGNFTSDAFIYSNNFGGISIDEVPLRYNTKEEGCQAFVENLKFNYFDVGLDSPESIGEKYCPANSEWAKIVYNLLEETE